MLCARVHIVSRDTYTTVHTELQQPRGSDRVPVTALKVCTYCKMLSSFVATLSLCVATLLFSFTAAQQETPYVAGYGGCDLITCSPIVGTSITFDTLCATYAAVRQSDAVYQQCVNDTSLAISDPLLSLPAAPCTIDGQSQYLTSLVTVYQAICTGTLCVFIYVDPGPTCSEDCLRLATTIACEFA